MLQTGERAPEIRLPDVQGKVTSLEEFYLRPEEPVLVVVFKVSCPTCQLTLPFLERLAQQRVQVLGISQDSASVTRDFAAHFHLTFPMLVDAAPYPVSGALRTTNVPSLFLIREDGTIVWDSVGFIRGDLEELGHVLHVGLFREDDKVPDRKPG